MTSRLSGSDRRRQLLDVAAEVFAAEGYHGASMEDVARRAGITKPILYKHFPSKQALYGQIVADAGERLLATILDATSRADGPRQQVEMGFEAYFSFVADHSAAFLVLFGSDARRDPDLLEAVEEVEDSIAGAIAGLIEAGLDDQHRRTLAHGIVGLGESVSRRWLAEDRPVPPDAMASRISALAWSGLRGVAPEDVEP